MRTLMAMTVLLLVPVANLVAAQSSSFRKGLNSDIPAAVHAKYKNIQDAKDWLNPKILISADGIEVVSDAIRDGRRTIPSGELRDLLIRLPVTAWPYGRVVLAQDLGLRRGDRSDTRSIGRNHDAAEKILKALDIEVDWWPSA